MENVPGNPYEWVLTLALDSFSINIDKFLLSIDLRSHSESIAEVPGPAPAALTPKEVYVIDVVHIFGAKHKEQYPRSLRKQMS